jgi:hypothetical protein
MAKRPIPDPILRALRDQFPRLLAGDIDGDQVVLLMADEKGQPDHAVLYIAGPKFLTAVRVADSGTANLDLLCGEGGFELDLLAPNGRTDNDDQV